METVVLVEGHSDVLAMGGVTNTARSTDDQLSLRAVLAHATGVRS